LYLPAVTTILIETHYLPCIAYFTALANCQRIVVEKYEHYEKQSYRTRCYLLGPHRVETLIVPVVTSGSKTRICDVRIDYSQKWLNNHWRTIRTAYGNAPYFEYYAPDLEEILFRKRLFLYDLNLELMTMCLKWLGREVSIEETQEYIPSVPADVKDLRNRINPKKPSHCNSFFKSKEYPQVFGSMFVPNLSLADLVFNQGPGAWEIVKASVVNEQ
jgi:hypothetical protein